MNVYSQQSEKCTVPIYFNDSVALFDGVLNHTNEVTLEDSVLYKIILYDCHGHSKVMIYENNEVLIEKGMYKNSLDTLKIYRSLMLIWYLSVGYKQMPKGIFLQKIMPKMALY